MVGCSRQWTIIEEGERGFLFVPVAWGVHVLLCDVQTLRTGEGVSTRPTPQCQVRMRVRGTLPSGASIDRSSSLSFIVGDGDVIQGSTVVPHTDTQTHTQYIYTHYMMMMMLAFPHLYLYPAIDIIASLMEKGEVCCVKADPRFAYGAAGRL